MRYGIVLLMCLLVGVAQAQWKSELPAMEIKKGQGGTICYHKPEDANLIIPPPAAYEAWKRNPATRTSATTFEVEYVNFSEEAKQAFQKAVDIWSGLIESPVPIRILAVWQPLSGSVLGGAAPGTYIRDFDGAPKIRTWYPVALAEKIAGREFNAADSPDIFAQFNSSFGDWSFRTDGVPVSQKTDLVSVVLHEIGHGLGIIKGYDVSGSEGVISDFFSDLHVPYDYFLENTSDLNLVQGFTPPSASLRAELTSNALLFRSPLLSKTPIDNRVKIYAPSTFASGSSIAHLDETTYNNTPNALMTPSIGNAEVMHNPGNLVMRMLADMGWVNTRIVHTRLPNTENVSTPYQVVATLEADTKNQDGGAYTYNASEVKLNYTTNGTTFTEVLMTATGQPNQFEATIPSTGSAITYGYFISVKDNLDRTLTKPGVYTADGAAPIQRFYDFTAGPDTNAPEIVHSQKAFILASATELTLEATITDNIGILQATLEYQINDGGLLTAPFTLVTGTTDQYTTTISLPALVQGDMLKYRIKATDNSVAQNVGAAPSVSSFYEANVVSLAETQNSYFNDFNSTSSDFFGDNVFNISTPAGFTNGAIHTSHPYPVGTGDGFVSNFVYQLRVPIKLKSTDATLKFDEIVLVEPGESGSVFGDDDFWDYVVVEGSKDGGITWMPMADGYDSRAQTAWLNKYNSASDNNNPPNSSALGDPSLYVTRTINMLGTGNFAANDEVVIRFRLKTDQLVVGWGWAIDNLKIQIDDTPPTILHNHIDYVVGPADEILVTLQPSDASGLDKIYVDLKFNDGEIQTEEIIAEELVSEYTLPVTVDGSFFDVGDKLEYRIRVTDLIGNEATLPASGFFQVPIINFGTPVTQYVTDFNTANADFAGNFFTTTQPTGFTSNAMHTVHPYPNGFGLTNSTSSYTLTLLKPITVSATNSYIQFSEIALVEYLGTAHKDFVVVEGSKDEGETWHQLVDAYSARSVTVWKNAFDGKVAGTAVLFKNRLIDITSAGDFDAGDNVLIRFRLSADGAGNGWGWAMDNLSIQGPVTGIKELADLLVSVYPNPTQGEVFTLEVKGLPAQVGQVQITNLQGQPLIADALSISGSTHKEYSTAGWADGIYIVRLSLEDGSTVTKKLVKQAYR